jgi:hypothetical protein
MVEIIRALRELILAIDAMSPGGMLGLLLDVVPSAIWIYGVTK